MKNIIFVYNLKTDVLEGRKISELKKFPEQLAAAQIHNHLILSGGYHQDYDKSSFISEAINYIYCIRKDQFKQIQNLQIPRSSHCVVGISTAQIYYLGGTVLSENYKLEMTKTCERSQQSKKNKMIPEMKEKRTKAGACAHNSQLFIFCGKSEPISTSTIEFLDLNKLAVGWKYVNLKPDPIWEARPGVSGISIAKDKILIYGNLKKDSKKKQSGTFYLDLNEGKKESKLTYVSNEYLIANSYQTPFVFSKGQVFCLSYQQYPNLYRFDPENSGPRKWKFEKLSL